MAPNTDYEYGVDLDRTGDNASSGIRYIGRSEMVEFVCYGEEGAKKPASKARAKSAKTDSKFARVKSPRMRRKSEHEDEEEVEVMAPVKPRKRCVTFKLDEPESYPTFDILPSLPPIETKQTAQEGRQKTSPKPLRKSGSLDGDSMTKLVPLNSPPPSPVTSPKLSKRGSFRGTTTSKRSETISVNKFSSDMSTYSPRSRLERVDSMLKKFEPFNGNKESVKPSQDGKRTPPASPRSPKPQKGDKSLFIDLENIDDYKPEKSRLKFIQAALSSTTSPRFVRPGSGTSSAPSSGRSSPLSLGDISVDGDNRSRTSCTFPELDSDSCASLSRPSSPNLAPPNSRVSTAAMRKPERGSGKTRSTIQETIVSLLGQSNRKWYD